MFFSGVSFMQPQLLRYPRPASALALLLTVGLLCTSCEGSRSNTATAPASPEITATPASPAPGGAASPSGSNSVPASPQAGTGLQVGPLAAVANDPTCQGTGGTIAYAETKTYRVFICGDEKAPTQPRYYRSRSKQGNLNLKATNYDPWQIRYFEFKNKGYSYIVQVPTSQIPDPVLAIEFPDGKRVEEKIIRYLAKDEVS